MSTQLARLAGTAFLWKGIQRVAVQLIFLVRLLVLSRILSPQDFGLLAIATTAVVFLLAITDFGMVPALVQRSQVDKEHYDVAWTVGLIRALAVTALVVCGAPFIAAIFKEPRATAILRVLAIVPLLEASASIRLADLTKKLHFRSLAFVGLAQALSNTCVAIALAPILGVWALVAGSLAGSTSYSIVSYLLAPNHPRLLFNRAALTPLLRFGRWIFITGLIAQLGIVALKAVISRQLGTSALGVYFLAQNIAFLPAQVASEVSGAVAFPLYARLQHNIRKATRTFQTLLIGLSVLLVPMSGLLIILSPSLVQHLLDPRWAGTAIIIQLLAVVGLIGLFGETVVPLLKGFGQPGKVAVLEIVQSLLVILSVWWLAKSYGLVGAALAMLAAITASQGISVMFTRQILEHPFRGLGRSMFFIVSAAGAGALVALVIDTFVPGILGVILAALGGGMVTVIVLWAADRRYNLALFQDLVRAFPQIAPLLGAAPATTADAM